MILTYKVKHQLDFSVQLKQAKQVAKFAIRNRDKLSSKHVSHIGLKSCISNQILRKYGCNKKCKKVKRVKLIIPNQGIKYSEGVVNIPCLSVVFPFDKQCQKVNQIEIDSTYYYVAVEIKEEPQYQVEGWVGVDRNTNGHCAVAACTKTSKVLKMGKKAKHTHEKYRSIRKKLQRLDKLKKLKTVKRRESNVVRDMNHKVSRKIVNYAKENRCGIKLEDLRGIRKNRKQAKSFKVHLNSWGYYQLGQFIEYKAQLAGVPVQYIEPAYTSQRCHKCGRLGDRNGKAFKCPHCGHASHADVNAAWNIAEKLLAEPKAEHCSKSVSPIAKAMGVYSQRLHQEEDWCNGSTDTPRLALVQMRPTRNPTALAVGGCQLYHAIMGL